MEEGYLALVLHAHLPYVRHSDDEESLAEHWLYEAMTETYIPLLVVLDRLVEDGVPFRMTVSLTPTLVTMLNDPLLPGRYLNHLERLIQLAEREITRTRKEPEFQTLAVMYHRLFSQTRDAFLHRYDRNLVQAWRSLQELGHVEIMASAATHGYLPLLSVIPSAIETQIGVGIDHYRQVFGRIPDGFWLPECGYYPGVDQILRNHGIRYTILETHGLTRADPRPRYGVYAPIYSPSGVAVFGRDPESSKQVWSSTEGYPGNHDYREFYRDIGYDLDLEYVKPYVLPDGSRLDTGFKYYRVTGPTDRKEVYVAERAERRAELHAGDFMEKRCRQIEHLASVMDRKPIVVAPYDAELFGHWWFEGPRWLDCLIRKIALEQEAVRLTTLSEYLERHPVNQVASPATSSWGYKGFHEAWLNARNDWIYPHLHRAAAALEELLRRYPRPPDLAVRARNQALRELLLAQASDWAFMINAGKMAEYAAHRIRTHLLQFFGLHDQIERQEIDEAWLAAVEQRDRLFPELQAQAAPPAPAGGQAGGAVVEPQAAAVEPGAAEATMVTARAVPSRAQAVRAVTGLSPDDILLFNEGSHFRIQEKLGAHLMTSDGVDGTHFAVWAPEARIVAVIGDFNGWDTSAHLLAPREDSGIWEGFIPGVEEGSRYKFHIASRYREYRADKADPFAFFCEVPPNTASLVWDLAYEWGDQEWMEQRASRNALDAPLSIYEVHLGSWRRAPEENNRHLSYRELAPLLAEYVTSMGFTHVEFLPVMEHPFYGSWGYQTTGYFAPTSRYGTPQDFMHLIDHLHQAGIGVILDWVPSHFPKDEHGPGYFDGTHLYEHQDPRQGLHPDWDSLIFNYGRKQVCSFLISSALFWLSTYHLDGLRVDAVASMLYLDYARREGEWIPNRYGGRENLEAIDFLRRLNTEVYRNHPDVQTIAEESTAWPMVSRPTDVGGLGFGLKWDMGWMHDTLHYLSQDPIHRSHHHNELTFRLLYAFGENFMLPLSHDEVVHGKGSLLGRMPGDEWQRYANLRLLFGYMYAQAGKKLLFMGGEFGQVPEWSHEASLEWEVLDYPVHAGVQRWVKDLNRLYATEPALHELDCEPEGFEWVDANDSAHSVISLIRRGKSTDDQFLVVANFTPVPRFAYRVGVPSGGFWQEVLNSDGHEYGGRGLGNLGGMDALPESANGRPHSLKLTLPPLSCLFLKSPRSQPVSRESGPGGTP